MSGESSAEDALDDIYGMIGDLENHIDDADDRSEERALKSLLKRAELVESFAQALFGDGHHVPLDALELVGRFLETQPVRVAGSSDCMPIQLWTTRRYPGGIVVAINRSDDHGWRFEAAYRRGAMSSSTVEAGVWKNGAVVIERLDDVHTARDFEITKFACTRKFGN